VEGLRPVAARGMQALKPKEKALQGQARASGPEADSTFETPSARMPSLEVARAWTRKEKARQAGLSL
jgi:hypothetical protein